ncbi:MAG: hypothetical protein ACOX9E_09650 [Lentisphaeria bacterium]|jgi:hypothetical protein
MRMKILCMVLPLVLVALLQTGCATARFVETHGMVREYFYGLGPVHQQEEAIYVQGMTQKFWEDRHNKSEPWPSYVILSVANNRVVKTEWVTPGELPKEILAAPELPYQRDDYHGVRERFDDFCKTQPPAKYYGGDWILIRNPDDPNSPNQFLVEPSRRYRAPSAYPTLCLVLPMTLLFDVATSPIQLIGAIIIHESFKNVH